MRVGLPFHLRQLAGVTGAVRVEVGGKVTMAAVLDEMERVYPMLRGTVREYGTGARRAYLRFFAGEEDLSFMRMEEELPEAVRSGREVLVVLGAISGG